jgi:chromosome segregation ATPase
MRSPLLTALFNPLNMLMAGLAVFAGLVSAWWLFPVGVVFWMVMVVTVSRDKALRFNQQMQQREPVAQRFQRYFDRIERAQVGVFNTLSASPAATRRALEPVQAEIDRLTREAYALCQRMTSLENYRVVAMSQSDLSQDLEQIERLMEQTQDPLVRSDYQASRQALQERLAKFEGVATQLDRVEAQLLSLANEMDGVVTEVVRLQAAGPESARRQVPDLVSRLQQETQRLRTFEQQAVDRD